VLFPVEWRVVSGVEDNYRRMWNGNHPTVAMVKRHHLTWITENLPSQEKFEQQLTLLFEERGRVAAWVMTRLFRGAEYWNAIRDHYPDAFAKAMELCCPRSESGEIMPLVYLCSGKSYSGSLDFIVLAPDRVDEPDTRSHEDGIEVKGLERLKWPSGTEWWLTSDDIDNESSRLGDDALR
jgi:hypothetical protein